MTKYKCLYDITGRIEDVATFLVPLQDLPKHDEPVIDKSAAIRIATALGWTPPKQEQRCKYCDGTGDVHDQTGEWRGVCVCEAGVSLGAKQEHGEPVAKYIGEGSEGSLVQLFEDVKKGTDFYTTPQQRKPLTDEQREDVLDEMYNTHGFVGEDVHEMVDYVINAVEAAHGIKVEA